MLVKRIQNDILNTIAYVCCHCVPDLLSTLSLFWGSGIEQIGSTKFPFTTIFAPSNPSRKALHPKWDLECIVRGKRVRGKLGTERNDPVGGKIEAKIRRRFCGKTHRINNAT